METTKVETNTLVAVFPPWPWPCPCHGLFGLLIIWIQLWPRAYNRITITILWRVWFCLRSRLSCIRALFSCIKFPGNFTVQGLEILFEIMILSLQSNMARASLIMALLSTLCFWLSWWSSWFSWRKAPFSSCKTSKVNLLLCCGEPQHILKY